MCVLPLHLSHAPSGDPYSHGPAAMAAAATVAVDGFLPSQRADSLLSSLPSGSFSSLTAVSAAAAADTAAAGAAQ